MTRTLPRLSVLCSTLLLALASQAQPGGGSGAGTGTGTGTGAGTGSPSMPGATTTRGNESTGAQADRPRLLRSDEGFLKQAAQDGHAEIESSKLALTKAQDPAVKAYAQKMIDDHTKANDELMTLARSKGVELPAEPSMAHRAKMKLLQAADGASFDRRYADSMGVEAHENTVKMFKKAAADARDPEIKAWAAKKVPALEMHLTEARALKRSTEAAGNASGSSDSGSRDSTAAPGDGRKSSGTMNKQ